MGRWLDNMSITTRTAIMLSALVGAIFVIAGLFSFHDADRRALATGLSTLDHYAQQVARQQEERFGRIRQTHARATELLRAELATNPRLNDSAAFDTMFPADPRGGRRSAPALYDGGTTPFGYVRGVGAFIAREPDADKRRLLMASAGIVSGLGEGVRPAMESLYLFTPQNDLVMFAADRKDRLAFYRKTAPSTLDFQLEEFATVAAPGNNPGRAMRCTSLRHILYDRTGGTWTTGCMTPIDFGGRHIGTWGTSVLLDQLLLQSDFADVPGAEVILISREGRLIHHPAYTRQRRMAPESMFDLTTTQDPKLQALWRFVQAEGTRPYLGKAEAIDAFVAMRRIDATGWYVLVVQDPAVMHAASTRTVVRVAITAAVCLVLQALAIFLLMRGQVGRPLRSLIERTRALTRRAPPARYRGDDRTTSRDEVVQLTQDFDVMAERLMSAQSELERKVAERTAALSRANQELKLAVTLDPLTGIPNRRHLVSEVDARLRDRRPEGQYLLVFDIDHFKRINDVHGHPVGDRALIQAANGLASLLREHDLCGRIGGEEFVAFVAAESQAEAMNIAERIRCGIASLETPGRYGEPVRMTVSIGVAGAREDDGFDAIFARADAALYEAKRRGRDRIVWHRIGTPPRERQKRDAA